MTLANNIAIAGIAIFLIIRGVIIMEKDHHSEVVKHDLDVAESMCDGHNWTHCECIGFNKETCVVISDGYVSGKLHCNKDCEPINK